MRQRISGLRLLLDGRPIDGETVVQEAGGYVLVVETVVPPAGLALTSCYLADLGGDTAVSHMRLLPGGRTAFRQGVLGRLPGQTHARGCLLDHVTELRAAAELELGAGVVFKVDDSALEHAGRVWLRPG